MLPNVSLCTRSSGEVKILTKGDNNYGDDREGRIYADGQMWVTREDIIGRARGLVAHYFQSPSRY